MRAEIGRPDEAAGQREPTSAKSRRRAALISAVFVATIALVVPAGVVQAASWNGYGNQFNYPNGRW